MRGTRSQEIDFVANKGNKQYYIQVAYSVAEEKAYEREFGAFSKLDNISFFANGDDFFRRKFSIQLYVIRFCCRLHFRYLFVI